MSGCEWDEAYGTDKVVCPYCGNFEFLNGEKLDEGRYVMKGCVGCGRSYAFKVEYEPVTTSYRYQGRTSTEYIDGTQKVKCSICGKPLERRREYRKCPVCGAVVCPSCTEQHEPCCDEYRRWVSDDMEMKP